MTDEAQTAVADPDSAGAPTTNRRFSLGQPAFPKLTPIDWVALASVVVLCTGFFTESLVPGWSPRFAVLLFVLPVGGLYLARLIAARDRAALVLAAALLWTIVVVPFQSSPMIRLLGVLGTEASVLIYLCVAACWALGRHISDEARALLPWVMFGAMAICGLVGVLQVVAQPETGFMVLERGRAHGLATYSIYYGSLLSAAAVFLAALDLDRRWRWTQSVGVLAFATAAGLSGSRAALVAAVFGVGYLVARRRDLVSWLAAGSVLVGTLVASWMSDYFTDRAARADTPASPSGSEGSGATTGEVPVATGGTDGSTVARLTGDDGFAGGGISWRIDAWEAGLDAWIERPITGWGVGNFRQAVQGTVGARFEQNAPRFDAHNFFVEMLATVGLPGLVVFTAFGVVCLLRSKGPIALAAATLAWSWLLQPMGISTLPLAMLLLGAAYVAAERAGDGDDAEEPGDVPDLLGGETGPGSAGQETDRRVPLLITLGLVLGAAFFVADLRLAQAVDDIDAEDLEAAAAAFPTDPLAADLVAQGWTFRVQDTFGDEQQEAVAEALEWSERAVERQRDVPRWLDRLALRQAQFGDYDAAVATLGEALELQPQRRESRRLLSRISDVAADPAVDELIDQTLCVANGDCDS